MFATASLLSTRRLRRLLSLLLLPAVVLSLFAAAAPAARAQQGASLCEGLEPGISWNGSISFSHADAANWENRAGDTVNYLIVDQYQASASTSAGISGALRPAPVYGPGVFQGLLTGNGSTDRSFDMLRTTTYPNFPPIQARPFGEPYAIAGGGASRGYVSVFIDPATCTASLSAGFDIDGVVSTPPGYGFTGVNVSIRNIPVTRVGTGFGLSGSASAIELYNGSNPVGDPPISDAYIWGVADNVALYYQQKLQRRDVATVPVNFLFVTEGAQTPEGQVTIDSVTLEHGDYPSAAWIPVPAEGTTDGNMVRVTIRLRNSGDQPAEALLDVAESVANTEIGFTCPDRVSVPPTGSGAPHEVRCTWNTSLFAFGAPFSEDGAGTPKPDRVVRVTLAPIGGTVRTLDTPIKVRPRPVFLIPTVNSTADYIGVLGELLSDHPARWTFLPVPGLATGGRNGDEDSATLDENAATLHAYVEQQRAALDAWEFDIVAHGYGGLVARNYIATYEPTVGEGLSAAHMLIMLGTPNLGTPCAAPFALANIKAGNPNTSAWVAQLPNAVRELNAWAAGRIEAFAPHAVGGVDDQLACLGHPYPVTNPGNLPSDRLVPYESAVYGSDIVAAVGAAHRTYILDLDVKWQVADWLSSLSVEWLLPRPATVAAQALAPPAESVQPAPIAEVLAVDVLAGATVERAFAVPTATTLGVSFPAARTLRAELVSPSGQVAASATVTDTDSLGLRVSNPGAGQWTLRLTSSGATAQRAAALVQVLGSSFVATAEAGLPAVDGTRLLTAALADGGRPVTGATVTAQFPGASATLTLRDDGQSGDGAANDGIYGGRLGGAAAVGLAVVEVQSSAGNRLVPVTLTAGDTQVAPPQVSAGGPYSVAEGASVSLSATGDAVLSYAWDLDGDGTFETSGQNASFSAVGVDGPTSRLVRLRASDPATGLSAMASASVTVVNVAPTASLGAPATATVGQPFTLALSGASDPGGDPLQFSFDCGQGFGQAGSATSASCTPTTAGALTVRARVADDDGGVSTYSATLTVSAAPQPGRPEVPLCYASGAQTWQDFAQGKQKNGKAVPRDRSNPAQALGLPQRTDTVNFVSLGFGGSLTLRFANPIVNDGTSKADLRVWETSFGDRNRAWSRYPEAVRVEVSLDGRTWTAIGRTTDKDQAYDLVLPRAQFVRLTDISDPRRFGSTDDGFDLDAIEALTGCVRP